MTKHASISLEEAADRLAIRELVEAYAHCADRRDAKGQMALFTPDAHFVVYMNAKDPQPGHSCRPLGEGNGGRCTSGNREAGKRGLREP